MKGIKHLIIVLFFLTIKHSGFSQTWVDTKHFEITGGQTNHNDTLPVGPMEICVTPNHTTYAIVRIDQDEINQLISISPSGSSTYGTTTISHSTTLATENCVRLHATPDNGCVYVFMHLSSGLINYNAVKVGGNNTWTKAYPSLPQIFVEDLVPTYFNSYYIVFSDSLVEVDSLGNFIRNRVPFTGYVSTMMDSDIIHFSSTINRESFTGTIKWSIPQSGFQSIYSDTSVIYALKGSTLMKINSHDGSINWSKNIPHSSYYRSNQISITSDYGFITCSDSDLITRYDSSGNIVWSTSVPFPQFGYTGIVENNPGSYITGGAYLCSNKDHIGLYHGFAYFLSKLDSTAHGVIDSTDHYYIGNANDNLIFSFSDDAPYVAAAMGSSGIGRSLVLRDWPSRSVFGTNWSARFATGLNFKYSDIDGNSVIDTADIRKLNDIGTFPYPSNIPSHWKNANQSTQIPDLKILFEEDSIFAGDSITVDVIIGDSTIPADSIYSFGLTLFNPQLLSNTGGVCTIPINDFGDPFINLYSFFSISSGSGIPINFVASRQDHQNAFLNGDTIAKFRIGTRNYLPTGSYTFYVGYNAITVNGFTVPLNLIQDTINLINTTGFEYFDKQQINIFPNPANNRLSVSYENDYFKNTKFIIFNSVNQLVYSKRIKSKDDLIDMDIKSLSDGIYYCHLISEDHNISIGKLTVIH